MYLVWISEWLSRKYHFRFPYGCPDVRYNAGYFGSIQTRSWRQRSLVITCGLTRDKNYTHLHNMIRGINDVRGNCRLLSKDPYVQFSHAGSAYFIGWGCGFEGKNGRGEGVPGIDADMFPHPPGVNPSPHSILTPHPAPTRVHTPQQGDHSHSFSRPSLHIVNLPAPRHHLPPIRSSDTASHVQLTPCRPHPCLPRIPT